MAVENAAVQDFLDAAGAWVADMDGYFAQRGEVVPDEPSWALVADRRIVRSLQLGVRRHPRRERRHRAGPAPRPSAGPRVAGPAGPVDAHPAAGQR
ncbi:DUF7660 family protein [Saccharopolyspora montiporae]|uniref:DUF7660 family protein n=1 Tax=Saccharopolyspora montiporae TaxID=2781240 RepID=UPI003F884D31